MTTTTKFIQANAFIQYLIRGLCGDPLDTPAVCCCHAQDDEDPLVLLLPGQELTSLLAIEERMEVERAEFLCEERERAEALKLEAMDEEYMDHMLEEML